MSFYVLKWNAGEVKINGVIQTEKRESREDM